MKNGGGYLFGIFDGHGGAACGQVDKKIPLKTLVVATPALLTNFLVCVVFIIDK